MTNRWGSNGNSDRLYLGGGLQKSLQMVTAAIKLKLGRKAIILKDLEGKL